MIHAAGGNDRLRPGKGNDEAWGDAGIDTVELPGNASDWRLKSADRMCVAMRCGSEQKIVLISKSGAGIGRMVKALYAVERVEVAGTIIPASKIKKLRRGDTIANAR